MMMMIMSMIHEDCDDDHDDDCCDCYQLTECNIINIFRYHHTAPINLIYTLRESLAMLVEEVSH